LQVVVWDAMVANWSWQGTVSAMCTVTYSLEGLHNACVRRLHLAPSQKEYPQEVHANRRVLHAALSKS